MRAENPDAEAEIRRLVEERAAAVRVKHIGRSINRYADDIVSFDVVNPLRMVGRDGVRSRTEQWFSSFTGPIGYENRDLVVIADDDVAFCHSLNHVQGTKTDGGSIEMWWRATLCFRRHGGQWWITHEHASVPFDPASGAASLGLEP